MTIMPKGQGRAPLAFLLSAWRRRQRPERVIDAAYPAWAAASQASPAEWRARIAAIKRPPRISVVMPVHDPKPAWLRAAVASVRNQIFAGWELLIADDASGNPEIAVLLAEYGGDPRIDVVRLSARGGISAASNAALARADGDYVAFLDHDDALAPHALAAMVCAFTEDPKLDLVFSDEDQLVAGHRAHPYFKPGWNPDLLLSQNMVCHLAVYRRTLVTELGGLRGDMVGAQDYDLALRVVDRVGPHRVRHLSLVLYHWRQSKKSFSATDMESCRDAARRALARHLGGQASVDMHASLPQWPRVHFHLADPPPSVSIVCDREFQVDEDAYEPALLQQVRDPAEATGELLLFLSPQLCPVSPGWLRALVAQASRAEIGAAGANLLGPHGQWSHTGYVLHAKHIVRTVAPPSDAADPGYRGHFALARTVSAVSGDCVAIRREVFLAAGCFTADAGDFVTVDLCLRLANRGLRTVWTPHATLRYARAPHTPTRGAAWMRQRWRDSLAADPYHNPNLQLTRGRLSLAPGG